MNKYVRLNRCFKIIAKSISGLALLFLGLMILFILKESIGFLDTKYIKDIFKLNWRPLSNEPSFGMKSMILGTLYVGFFATILALPLTVMTAAFITIYLKDKSKHIMLAFIDMLAGIPSVVYGLIGFFTFLKFLEKNTKMSTGESALVAILTLALMVMPYMISSYVHAFYTISKKYSMQTKILGVTKWYSMYHLIIVRAKGHILTGYMLALSRALGETMAVMMVIGNSPLLPKLLGKGITLSGLIALEMGSARLGSLHYKSLYTAGLILLLLLIIINIIIRKVERKVKLNEK